MPLALGAKTQPWRVVGNLPYNISSPLIMRLLDHVLAHPGNIQDMHFMLQKEMAERLSAQPGSKAWGRLSAMTQITVRAEYLFDSPPQSFHPPPKVDSSILRLTPRAPAALTVPRKSLDKVLRLAFAGRRKRMSNALKTLQLDWTALAVDGLPSAHFEHTLLVDEGKPEILTIPEGHGEAEDFFASKLAEVA